MARTGKNITKEQLEKALETALTQTKAAMELGVTQSFVSQLMKKYEIDASVIGQTDRDEKIEAPDYTYAQVKEITRALMGANTPTVGYDEVSIKLDTKYNSLIIPIADIHAGARWVWYDQLEEDIDFIRDNANVFCGFNGDYCDNYEIGPYRQGRHEQQLSLQQQKAIIETYIKQLKGKILWFIDGCHDEWSYISDGFDIAQYLSGKDKQGYYLGHNGFVNLTVGDILYKFYTTHKVSGGKKSPGTGLKDVLFYHGDYDVAISAHKHQPHVEDFIIRKQRRYIVACGSYKGQDRNGSQQGYPPLKVDRPGILLNPRKKEIMTSINYKELIQYL